MKKCIYAALLLLFAACKEKYDLPFEVPANGYLVVEGVLTSGDDSTTIELSRTGTVNNNKKIYEPGANVAVLGEDNSSTQLLETAPGIYSNKLNLNATTRYRLQIRTSAGKEYQSAYVGVKTTPAIDSINFVYGSEGMRFYVSTHDPSNNTKYYLWQFKETWEIHSAYQSFLKYTTKVVNGQTENSVGYRDSVKLTFDTSLYRCWVNANSANLLIGSSEKLSEDVIYQQPIHFVTKGDRRMSVLYSIDVKQYGITKEAYQFLDKMKKNTEGSGSIFDPQPSQLNGNIICVSDTTEPVIGFISAATVTSKRIFVGQVSVPNWNYQNFCRLDSVKNHTDSIALAKAGGLIPADIIYANGNDIAVFGVSTPLCIDCTLSGSNKKPTFWP